MDPTELWRQIVAAPADADRKARYLEALTAAGDWRAEVVPTAIEFERLRAGSYINMAAQLRPKRDALIERRRADFAAQMSAWRAELTFVLGWPIEITIAAADFARYAGEIVATLPVRHLNLTAVAGFPAVFATPQLDQIASLDGSKQPWPDDAVRALTTSAHAGALRWIDLSRAHLGESQVEMLAASPVLRTVEVMILSDNPSRDPVDAAAGSGTDWMTNRIVPESVHLPLYGYELERRYGEIGWLHGLWHYMDDYPPSRYIF